MNTIQLISFIILWLAFIGEFITTHHLIKENKELTERNAGLELANKVNKASIQAVMEMLGEKEKEEKEEKQKKQKKQKRTTDYKEQIIQMRKDWKLIREIAEATGLTESAISKALQRWSK